MSQVDQILADLGLADKPRLLVFNKADRLPELKRADTIAFLKARQLARRHNAIFVSALDPASLEPLLSEMEQRFWASPRHAFTDSAAEPK
jgi:GTP-binding protein HflX